MKNKTKKTWSKPIIRKLLPSDSLYQRARQTLDTEAKAVVEFSK